MELDVAELQDELTEQDGTSAQTPFRRAEPVPSDDFDDFLELLKEIRM